MTTPVAPSQVNPGDRAYASQLRAVAGASATKTADESVTSSTTYQNDDALFVAIDGSKNYRFDVDLFFDGANGTNIGFKWTVPSGTTMIYQVVGNNTSDAVSVGHVFDQTGNPQFATTGAGTKQGAKFSGTVFGGGVDGTLQLQWAPLASSGTAMIVRLGSRLNLWADN